MRIHLDVGVARDWWPLDPSDSSRMMGGTELLALRLARMLAARGHGVSFRGGEALGWHDGVAFTGSEPPADAVDLLIAVMRDPPSDVQARRRVAWSHGAQWPVGGAWDAVVGVSPYHAGQLRQRLLNTRVEAIRPGTDLPPLQQRPRDRFLYASSPDRGLHRLLAVWPALWSRFRIPLAIAYDLRAVLARRGDQPGPLGDRLRAIGPLLDQPGVLPQGALTPDELHDLRARSLAMLYPLDPFLPHSELLSLSVLEACAAGVPPILAPVDCFPSEYGAVARFVARDAPDYSERAWIEAIDEVLSDAEAPERVRAWAARRSWESFADGWCELLEEVARSRRPVAAGSSRQAWLVVAEGREARGEAALARHVVQAAHGRGHQVTVFTDTPQNASILEGPWALRMIGDGVAMTRRIAAGPARILLSSSIGCHRALQIIERMAPQVPTAALEHTWPEGLGPLPGSQVIRLVLNTLPPQVFAKGLEQGFFHLGAQELTRSRCVGPLGSALRREPTRDSRQSVFIHLGTGRSWTPKASVALFEALDALQKKRNLDVCYVCGTDSFAVPSWVERRLDLAFDEFQDGIARADLVICPDVAGTLGEALAAGTPALIISNGEVFGARPDSPSLRWCQAHHLAGVADFVPGLVPAGIYARAIAALLDSPRPEPLGGGAGRAVSWVENL